MQQNKTIMMNLEGNQLVATKQFELINGEFSPADAKDILTHLFQEKINFHKVKNLNSHLREGHGCAVNVNRAEELMKTKEEVLELLRNADYEGQKLVISAKISIELI